MTGGLKGLLLLSLCLVVWTVPIDRKQDPPLEEKAEENVVRLVSIMLIEYNMPCGSITCSMFTCSLVLAVRHYLRILVCTTTVTSER